MQTERVLNTQIVCTV